MLMHFFTPPLLLLMTHHEETQLKAFVYCSALTLGGWGGGMMKVQKHPLSSKVVNKFVCASFNASYVGQMNQHLTTRINDEHFEGKKGKFVTKIFFQIILNEVLKICKK